VVALASLISGVIDGRRSGWGSPEIVGCFAVAFVCTALLVAYEARRSDPLIDMRFFRSLPFATATIIAVLAFASFSSFLFLNSLYLQDTRGLNASVAGLCTLPIALMIVVCSPLSGRLVGVGRARLALVTAGLSMTTGAVLLTSLRAQAGIAAAVASTSRQVGASLGVALAGSIAGEAVSPAFASSTHAVWWLLGGLGLAVVALGLAATGERARASVKQVAFLLDSREDAPLALSPTSDRTTVLQ